MIHIIDFSTMDTINFSPRNSYEEICQNVRTILNTHHFSVPLARAFGIKVNLIDLPSTVQTQSLIQNEIFEALRQYEPRAELIEITFSVGADGYTRPRIILNIKEG